MSRVLFTVASKLRAKATDMSQNAPRTDETYGCVKALEHMADIITESAIEEEEKEVVSVEDIVKRMMGAEVESMIALEVGKLLGEPQTPAKKPKGKSK